MAVEIDFLRGSNVARVTTRAHIFKTAVFFNFHSHERPTSSMRPFSSHNSRNDGTAGGVARLSVSCLLKLIGKRSFNFECG